MCVRLEICAPYIRCGNTRVGELIDMVDGISRARRSNTIVCCKCLTLRVYDHHNSYRLILVTTSAFRVYIGRGAVRLKCTGLGKPIYYIREKYMFRVCVVFDIQ